MNLSLLILCLDKLFHLPKLTIICRLRSIIQSKIYFAFEIFEIHSVIVHQNLIKMFACCCCCLCVCRKP